MNILKREDFLRLFMWGIQFDSELLRIAADPNKRNKGSYWTPAIMAFLDRLGFKLGFKTDVEVGIKGGGRLDMLWELNDFHIRIEHEGNPGKETIKKAIYRLNGSLEREKKECLRILIAYEYPEDKGETLRRVKEFANADKNNLVLWFPDSEWPRDEKPVNMTKYDAFPEEDDIKNILEDIRGSFEK